MNRTLLAIIVSIAFIAVLAVIDSYTNAAQAVLLQAHNTYSECLSLASQFNGPFIQQRCAALDELNNFRIKSGRMPVKPHPFLMQSAQWWSEVQAAEREGGHPGVINSRALKKYPNIVRRSKLFCSSNQNAGQSFSIKPRQFVYDYARAYNYKNEGHNENQLNHAWKFAGVGIAVGLCPGSMLSINNLPQTSTKKCVYDTFDFGG